MSHSNLMPLPRVLVVDDHPANIDSVVAALSNDCEMQVATSGEAALRVLEGRLLPELILLDIMMPGIDGYETYRRIQANPRVAGIPVIFVTALAEKLDEAKGLELGAEDYIIKPIHLGVLRKRVLNLLERQRLRQQQAAYRDRLEEQVRERTLSLSIAKEAAETADRLKTTILSNINHEFRTPMNAILGMVGIAKRKIDDPKIQDYLAKAELSANQLLATLTNLLDLALVESNRLTLERAPFRVADVTARIVESLDAALRAKGLSLECHDTMASGPHASARLMGDALRIGQILQELMGNAIKFSNQGTVTVESSVTEEASGQLWLSYQVSDEGIGIAPENQRDLFQPFRQIDGSATRRGGNGIGLALCQRLARRMGGDIQVSSVPGSGSTFTLRIPVEAWV